MDTLCKAMQAHLKFTLLYYCLITNLQQKYLEPFNQSAGIEILFLNNKIAAIQIFLKRKTDSHIFHCIN